MQKVFSTLLQFYFYALWFLFSAGQILLAEASLAQVTSDTTIVDTQVTQDGNVAEITGGETQGGNLFHSFQDFSVPTGNEAYFNNANNIENIFSRVTGGNISNIDGLIRNNGSANLFLINPAGIIFGEGARLDIGGSFYGGSASSILFENGEFSAADLENAPLLTVNAPIGLGFRDNPGNIVSRANSGLSEQTFAQEINGEATTVNRVTSITGLEVNPERNLALIGGNVLLERSGITAPGGNVTLAGLTQAGQVTFDNGNFGFPEEINKADLSLNDSAVVSVVGNGGGSIDVKVNNLTLTQQSQLLAGIAEGAGDIDTVAGNIVINASESVTLTGSGEFENPTIDLDTAMINAVGLASTRVKSSNNVDGTAGSSGSIFINTKALNLTERSAIITRLYGVGNAQNININADTVSLNQGAITSQVGFEGSKGKGKSGDININSNNFEATNESFVITDNRGTGEGNAGDINLSATNSVVIQDEGAFTAFISETEEGTVGDAGDINITTSSLRLSNNIELLTQVGGQGNTGSINLEVADSLVINGGATLKAQILKAGEGEGGNIQINTNTFELSEGSEILTNGQNIGNAGDIIIQADESVLVSNGEINSQIRKEREDDVVGSVENLLGNTGDIKITANSLDLENNAQLSTQVQGKGNTGSIELEIADSTVINDADLQAQILPRGEGETGNIQIGTYTLELSENSELLTSSPNVGDVGDIIIQADESVLVDNSKIESQVEEGGVGNTGDIEITTNSLNLENNAQLLTQIAGAGKAGSIDLKVADSIVIDRGSDIQAQVINQGEGEGGDIQINADTFELLEDSQLLTDSRSRGDSGDIVIQANEAVSVNGSLISTGTIEGSQGNSGRIEIVSPQVFLTDRSIISSSPEGVGATADININAETISLNNFSLITASSRSEISQESGNINLTSDLLTVKNGSIINATTSSQFNGGQINIDSRVLELFSGGVLQTATDSDGNAGDINLTIGDRTILNGNNAPNRPSNFDFAEPLLNNLEGKTGIFANANNATLSNGGNININSDFIVAFPDGNSDIIANAQQGKGGNITINVRSVFGIEERELNDLTNDINASSDVMGLDGSVAIDSLNVDPIQESRGLPKDVVEPEQTVAQVCQTNQQTAVQNTFTIKGKGDIPPTPDLPLDSFNISIDGKTNHTSATLQPIETNQGKIQPARGIKTTKSGDVILTAYRTNNSGDRIVANERNCG